MMRKAAANHGHYAATRYDYRYSHLYRMLYMHHHAASSPLANNVATQLPTLLSPACPAPSAVVIPHRFGCRGHRGALVQVTTKIFDPHGIDNCGP